MKTGVPTKILTVTPRRNQLLKIRESLSDTVKRRLKIIDWYRLESAKYSLSGKPDVSLTCRHFGIHRSKFYRWKNRYKSRNLLSLENISTRPKHLRKALYNDELVGLIREIRIKHPTYSKVMIKQILCRDYGIKASESTIGRIIKKYDMFYVPARIKERKECSKAIKRAKERKRLPYNLRATEPQEIIEFDMKHINVMGRKMYAMCGIDQYTRKAVIHIAGRPTSNCAREALMKVVNKFGRRVKVVNDNGSENMGRAEEWLDREGIEQLWARPHKPKDKPFVERFIQTFEKECLNFNYMAGNTAEMQKVADKWVEEYEGYRPHRSLGMLTPNEYESMILKSGQLSGRVSYMY